MPGAHFDPTENNIPPVLRERIESWQTHPPSTQFQQYGPINRYLNLKFDHDDHMVKPQALFREPVPTQDAALIAVYGPDPEGDLPSDAEDATTVEDLRISIHRGDISIDSTLNGLVDKRVKDGSKVYPDFVVCTFVGNPRKFGDEAEKDRVLIVMEIASLPREETLSKLPTKELKSMKEAVLDQLEGYMDRLGERGDRWDDKAIGIALFGTEVAFIVHHDGSGSNHKNWKRYKYRNKVWYSLYGKEFLRFVNGAKDD